MSRPSTTITPSERWSITSALTCSCSFAASLAFQRRLLLAVQARGRLVDEVGDDEVAGARQRGLEVALRRFGRARAAQPPGPGQQQQGGGRGRAQGQGEGAQHARHQDGQAEQGRVVHRARLQHLQAGDQRQVHPDGGQPADAGLGRGRLLARDGQRHDRRQQVERAQPGQGRACALVEGETQGLQQQQGHGHHHAAGEEAGPQACERRIRHGHLQGGVGPLGHAAA